MAERQTEEGTNTDSPRSADEAWREVGRGFEVLGESLSRAVGVAWRSEETQRHVRSIQHGLKKMAGEIDRALKEATESEQGERLRWEAERAAGSLRQAGAETWRGTRPQLLTALRRVDVELRTLIENLEQSPPSSSDSVACSPSDTASQTMGAAEEV